jgi:hypothetical protein
MLDLILKVCTYFLLLRHNIYSKMRRWGVHSPECLKLDDDAVTSDYLCTFELVNQRSK